MKEFTAILEQDEDWYIAYSPEIPGANKQGPESLCLWHEAEYTAAPLARSRLCLEARRRQLVTLATFREAASFPEGYDFQ